MAFSNMFFRSFCFIILFVVTTALLRPWPSRISSTIKAFKSNGSLLITERSTGDAGVKPEAEPKIKTNIILGAFEPVISSVASIFIGDPLIQRSTTSLLSTILWTFFGAYGERQGGGSGSGSGSIQDDVSVSVNPKMIMILPLCTNETSVETPNDGPIQIAISYPMDAKIDTKSSVSSNAEQSRDTLVSEEPLLESILHAGGFLLFFDRF